MVRYSSKDRDDVEVALDLDISRLERGMNENHVLAALLLPFWAAAILAILALTLLDRLLGVKHS